MAVFFMAPPYFVSCGFDEFASGTLAAQAIVDKGVDNVVIAVFPFDEVYFSYDRSSFIFHPDFIGSIL